MVRQRAHTRVVPTVKGMKKIRVNPDNLKRSVNLIHKRYRKNISAAKLKKTKIVFEYNGGYPPPKGFLVRVMQEEESKYVGRWNWYLNSMVKGKIILPIPQVRFSTPQPEVNKMLMKCVNIVTRSGTYTVRAAEIFIEWLAFGLSAGDNLPKEINADIHTALLKTFDISLLLKFPSDYLASILSEAGSRGGPGWFATPMNITIMMSEMLSGDKELVENTGDCCVGTGGMLLPASNFSLKLYGQDISHIMVVSTKVNLALYAPHGFRQFPDEMIKEAMKRKHEHKKGLEIIEKMRLKYEKIGKIKDETKN